MCYPPPPQVEAEPCTLVPTTMTFLENHGKNIQLSNQNLTAARVSSYNQGLLVTAQPLARQQLLQVSLSVIFIGGGGGVLMEPSQLRSRITTQTSSTF